MVVARSSPDPPVRFTMVCTIDGVHGFHQSPPGHAGPLSLRRGETCVWKSITGTRTGDVGFVHVQHALRLELRERQRRALVGRLLGPLVRRVARAASP